MKALSRVDCSRQTDVPAVSALVVAMCAIDARHGARQFKKAAAWSGFIERHHGARSAAFACLHRSKQDGGRGGGGGKGGEDKCEHRSRRKRVATAEQISTTYSTTVPLPFTPCQRPIFRRSAAPSASSARSSSFVRSGYAAVELWRRASSRKARRRSSPRAFPHWRDARDVPDAFVNATDPRCAALRDFSNGTTSSC